MSTERQISYRDAIRETLFSEMRRDPTIVMMGEDIAGGLGGMKRDAGGGVYKVTRGLITEFGEDRVRDTPISEAAFIGTAVGAALTGLRPVVELMHVDFIGVCFDQLLNQAAKVRYMFGGQTKVPIVIRTTIGAGASAAAQHSQNLYSIFVHIPGLKVVIPSTPYDAKGLLLTSIRDDNPVIYMENKVLYMEKGPVPEEEYTIPFGKANVVREGKDVTVVALSRMVYFAMEAAKELARDGIEVEIIDPRTLYPLDEETIIKSVEKTGRLVIYDEDTPRCSMATDIAAMVADKGFYYLDAPIKMVTAPHVPVPFSPSLEKYYVPDARKLIATVKGII